jgi:hypothetical protein
MKNTYLKRFMPMTSNDKKIITITFQAEIYKHQDIEHVEDRTGKGYALSLFKVFDSNTKPTKEKVSPIVPDFGKKLITRVHHIKLDENWDKVENHVTSLLLLHNPAADSDSMVTSDAPMF